MHVPALNYKSWCGIHWGKPPSYSENCGKTNMPPWWGRSSSKEAKKKTNKESFIDTLHRKFKIPSDDKSNNRSGGSKRQCSDMVSEKGSAPQVKPRSPSLSEQALRCQNFSEGPLAQPLPLPSLHPASIGFSDSGISVPPKPMLEKTSKLSLCSPLPRPACIHGRTNPFDVDGGDLLTTSVSSGSSIDIDDPINSKNRSHHAIGYENGTVTAASALPCSMPKNQISTVAQFDSREAQSPDLLLSNQSSISSPKRRPLSGHVPCLQVTHHGPFFSAPDSSMSSPSRSPRRAFGLEQVMYSAIYSGRPYPDATFVSSGHCSSPGSGFNSGHNSMGGDMGGQLFWQHSRGSPEYSPIPSPRMTSPGPSSRIHSGAVTPIHPRAGGAAAESQSSWHDDVKQQSHRLPLPPVAISCSTFSPSSSPVASPSVSRSPGTTDNPTSPSSRWKKGKLLGRGSFGHVYVGFDSGSGEMCAMKEVTLFSDDAKSKESAKQLNQEIALLSRLRHPNIVQYYGSETVGDKLYIYLEYVSGGSIYKLLQEYGQFGELAVRNYTQQILSGLAYLHAKNTVHRDIKGANILVDPSGRVKLADFGMAKHITGQSCPLSFKGSPYWMAPEVIKNSKGCNRAVDIWSLGCTVLEMATTKPPWSQYEGVAAMFKIGNSKELPPIPNHLSDDGKDFVRLCLQRNLQYRPTAAQLLEHPFVRNAVLLVLERPLPSVEPSDPPPGVTSDMKSLGIGHRRNISGIDSERLAVHSSRVSKSDGYSTRNISCPVSPIGSPLLRARSPQHRHGGTSPPLPSPRTPSGSSTPLAAGSGASPFHHHKQSVYFQEGVGNGPNSPNNIHHANGISYHDIFGGSCESEVQGKHPGRRLAHGDLYDRVSRELLRDRLMMNPSVDLGPRSPLTSHTNCT